MAHGRRYEALSKVANASVCPSLIKGMGGHASIDIITRYIKPNQQAIDAAVRAKHGSPSKIRVAPAPAPAPALAPAHLALAPAPPSPAPPTEESPAPAPFLDGSPLPSIQHSFGDHSNADSISSDFVAGALGLITQQFEVPKDSFPLFPSNISFATGEEPTPIPMPFTDRTNHPTTRIVADFAEDCPQYKDHPPKPQLRYKHYNRYEPLYKEPHPPHTQSYDESQYKERKPPPWPPQDPHRVSFGENWSYEPRYEEPRYEEHKPPPYQSYEPQYKKHKAPSRLPCTSTQSYKQHPSLAERGPQAPPPPQDCDHASFGENHYHCYEEQNGAWGPSPMEVYSHSTPRPSGRVFFAPTDPEVQATPPKHGLDASLTPLDRSNGPGPMTQVAAFGLLGMVDDNNDSPPPYTKDPVMKNVGAEICFGLSDDENTYAPAIELAPDTDTNQVASKMPPPEKPAAETAAAAAAASATTMTAATATATATAEPDQFHNYDAKTLLANSNLFNTFGDKGEDFENADANTKEYNKSQIRLHDNFMKLVANATDPAKNDPGDEILYGMFTKKELMNDDWKGKKIEDLTLGTKRNKAKFDEFVDEKFKKVIDDGTYKPYEDIDELLVYLKWDYLKLGVFAYGAMKDVKYIIIAPSGGFCKTNGLNINNPTKNKQHSMVVEDPENRNCIIKLIYFYRARCNESQKKTTNIYFKPKSPVGANTIQKWVRESAQVADFKDWENSGLHYQKEETKPAIDNDNNINNNDNKKNNNSDNKPPIAPNTKQVVVVVIDINVDQQNKENIPSSTNNINKTFTNEVNWLHWIGKQLQKGKTNLEQQLEKQKDLHEKELLQQQTEADSKLAELKDQYAKDLEDAKKIATKEAADDFKLSKMEWRNEKGRMEADHRKQVALAENKIENEQRLRDIELKGKQNKISQLH
eukprot:jgi/Psemu1/11862/gm1.11862_g